MRHVTFRYLPHLPCPPGRIFDLMRKFFDRNDSSAGEKSRSEKFFVRDSSKTTGIMGSTVVADFEGHPLAFRACFP